MYKINLQCVTLYYNYFYDKIIWFYFSFSVILHIQSLRAQRTKQIDMADFYAPCWKLWWDGIPKKPYL